MIPLPAELIRTRRRSLSVAVTPDARLVVRAPLRLSAKEIHRFLLQKGEWISRTLERARERRRGWRPKIFRDGETFLLAGRPLILTISTAGGKTARAGDCLFLPLQKLTRAREELIRWYRREAREMVSALVEENCRQHGFSAAGIKINGAARRWGSCGPDHSLNFSWRLAMAPLDVINYVVVHELCHTRVRNHSSRFWRAVAAVLPSGEEQRRWLRENNGLLEDEYSALQAGVPDTEAPDRKMAGHPVPARFGEQLTLELPA